MNPLCYNTHSNSVSTVVATTVDDNTYPSVPHLPQPGYQLVAALARKVSE